jgi:hypothetical protein
LNQRDEVNQDVREDHSGEPALAAPDIRSQTDSPVRGHRVPRRLIFMTQSSAFCPCALPVDPRTDQEGQREAISE